METILLPIGREESIEPALKTAVSVSRRFDSYLEGLFVQQTPPVFVSAPMAVTPAYVTQLTEDWREQAGKARAKFGEFMKQQNISFDSRTADREGTFAGWREVEGQEYDVVGEYGRLFDLIVLPRVKTRVGSGVTPTWESALFETGRPVLLAPPNPGEQLGHTIVIAWNRSTEIARTIALGMSFIREAEKVYVLALEGGTVPGQTGEQMADQLIRHCARTEAITADPGNRSRGEAILEEADKLGADLLFKGAYTQSRLRQMIFGGATRHILGAAEIPVLMAS